MKYDIHFLPAKYGDCIWIEYGPENNTKRLLIDGGTGGTKTRIKEMLEEIPGDKEFELLVVTHIDRDHIEGVLSLLEEDSIDFKLKDVWFNGWGHLISNNLEPFGAVQGERLSAAILKHEFDWNSKFNHEAVVLPTDGSLPEKDIAGMKITLLSPTRQALVKLKDKWEDEVTEAGLDPGFGIAEPVDGDIQGFGPTIPDMELLLLEEFKEDNAAANGSSIAFIAEYAGKKVLFTGDAYPGVILDSLNRKYAGDVSLDLVKLSHHASAGNTSPELIRKLACQRYVISTNGSIFRHPAQVTLARILDIQGAGTEFIFNYRSTHNECWDNEDFKSEYGLTSTYPPDGGEGIIVSLL